MKPAKKPKKPKPPANVDWWDIRCKAAFIALYGAMRLCDDIGMNPYDLLDMLRSRLAEDGCLDKDGRVVPYVPAKGARR